MRNRMLVSYLLVAVVSLTVAFLAATVFVQSTIVDHFRKIQIAECEPFQEFFEQYYSAHGSWDGISQLDIHNLMNDSIPEKDSHFGLSLVDVNGAILLTDNKAQYGTVVEKSSLAFGAPVVVNGETVAYLYSGSLTDRILPSLDTELIKRTRISFILAMIIGLVVAFFMSTFMTRALLRPIGVTIEAAKRISKGELNLRIPLEPYRDMAELGEAVNDMAADLEKNQRVQKFMLMDIAHDLRTPLSVQKATIEAFEDKVYQFDEAGLALLKMQNNQLIHLVEDLRLLTLSDAGIFTIRKEKVELQIFVQDILNSFESVFAKKGIRAVFSSDQDDYRIGIDTHLMRRVFQNLFQNAYQHSPEGGEIQVRILKMINRLEIIVADQGPGIPKDKLVTIFNRYYRVSPAGEEVPEGLGIGLTISRSIVEAHGGKLYARNLPISGAEFVIELPYSA